MRPLHCRWTNLQATQILSISDRLGSDTPVAEQVKANMDTKVLAQAATIARGLAIDAVHACNSGHLGLPLGTAEIGAVLFGEKLQYAPHDPRWLNRDRFVL